MTDNRALGPALVAGASRLTRAAHWKQLPSVRPWLIHGAVILWALVASPFALFMATTGQRPWALVALLAIPAGWMLRKRPTLAAAAIIVGAAILRLSFLGYSGSDPIAVSQLASDRALQGLDPYGGFLYAGGSDAMPYPYGPLGLVTYRAGIPGEFIATLATSALLAWRRAWMTLAFFNAWPQFLYTPMIGNNDYSVGFVLALALVLLPIRRVGAMALLTAAIAIKPYAAAWFLPALGFVGLGTAAVVGGGLALVLWSPVLFVWGPRSFLDSLVALEDSRVANLAIPSWSFADIPVLRLLVVPTSIAGLFVRSWRATLLLGSAGFLVFLGFSPWAHHAYLGALVPIVGLAVEGAPYPRQQDGGEHVG